MTTDDEPSEEEVPSDDEPSEEDVPPPSTPKKGGGRRGSMPRRWVNSRQGNSTTAKRIDDLYDEAKELHNRLENREDVKIGGRPQRPIQSKKVDLGYVDRNKHLDRGKVGRWERELKSWKEDTEESLNNLITDLKQKLHEEQHKRTSLYNTASELALGLGKDPPPQDATIWEYTSLVNRHKNTERLRAEEHRKEFTGWLREEVEADSDPVPPKSGGGLTDSQRSVIDHSGSDAVLVCACAGSGKTHTMIHKICHLVDKEGVNPRGIWVLSFTNAAVNEARRRLSLAFHEEDIEEDDLAIQVMTIDSLAAKINFEATGDYLAGSGYEENIVSAVKHCKLYVQNLGIDPSHILIDESQDLERPRAHLIFALVRSLKGCQFTFFFDRHQAIYGWSQDTTEEQDDLDGGLMFLKLLHRYHMELKGSAPKVIRLEPVLFRAGNDAIHDLQTQARRMIRGSTRDARTAANELSDLLKGAGS